MSELLRWEPTEQDRVAFARWSCDDPFTEEQFEPLFICADQTDARMKYLLGPTLMSGQRIDSAQVERSEDAQAWYYFLPWGLVTFPRTAGQSSR
jgi:hypothetical protein